MKLGKAFSAVTAFALVAAPVAASAGTRAADALPASKPMFESMGARQSVAMKSVKNAAAGALPLAAAGTALVISAVVLAAKGKSTPVCRSPGAC